MNAKDIIRQIAELESGIIPECVWYDTSGGINQDRWSSMDEKEIRRSKRKFRKIFRKACRHFELTPGRLKHPNQRSRIVRRYVAEVFAGDKQ